MEGSADEQIKLIGIFLYLNDIVIIINKNKKICDDNDMYI